MKLLNSFRQSEAGNVAVSFAVALLPLASFAGAAVDYSRATFARQRLQATVDAAALNAARVSTPGDSRRIAVAQSFFPTSTDPLMPTATVSAASKSVTVSATQSVRTAFLGVAGITQIAIGARATAIPLKDGPPICVLALNQTAPGAVSFAGNASFSAQNCAIYSNSSSSSAISVQGSASVQAAGFCSAGGVSGGAALTPPPLTSCDRVDDPFRNVAAPATAGCDYRNVSVNPNTTRALSPGIYCGGLNLKGTVTLSPGLYVIKDGVFSVGSQANVTISGSGGVTFYLTGQGAGLDMDGSGGLNLSAQTSGPYAGILVMQDRASNAGATSKLNGNSNTILKGGIYLPTQTLSLTGNNSFGQQSDFMPLIADQISFSGSSTAKLDLTALPTSAPIPTLSVGARLVQ